MQRQGVEVPPDIGVSLLIDTGASHTFLDDQVTRGLALERRGESMFHSSSTKGVPERCHEYDVSLVLGGITTPNTWRIEMLNVMGHPFLNNSHQGVLGRDVLDRLQFAWNGPARLMVLSYP